MEAALAEVRARHALELDPMRMSARELRLLPGVGRSRARAIVEHRRVLRARQAASHDPRATRVPGLDGSALRTAASWESVPGIGPRTAVGVLAWLEERWAQSGKSRR